MIRMALSAMSKAMSVALMLIALSTPFSFSKTNGYLKDDGLDWGLVMVTMLSMAATWLTAMMFAHLSRDLKKKR